MTNTKKTRPHKRRTKKPRPVQTTAKEKRDLQNRCNKAQSELQNFLMELRKEQGYTNAELCEDLGITEHEGWSVQGRIKKQNVPFCKYAIMGSHLTKDNKELQYDFLEHIRKILFP